MDIVEWLRTPRRALVNGQIREVLDPKLIEAAAEIERLRAALKSAQSWMDRWAAHVGRCKAGAQCTCGRNAILHEINAALYEQNGSDR